MGLCHGNSGNAAEADTPLALPPQQRTVLFVASHAAPHARSGRRRSRAASPQGAPTSPRAGDAMGGAGGAATAGAHGAATSASGAAAAAGGRPQAQGRLSSISRSLSGSTDGGGGAPLQAAPCAAAAAAANASLSDVTKFELRGDRESEGEGVPRTAEPAGSSADSLVHGVAVDGAPASPPAAPARDTIAPYILPPLPGAVPAPTSAFRVPRPAAEPPDASSADATQPAPRPPLSASAPSMLAQQRLRPGVQLGAQRTLAALRASDADAARAATPVSGGVTAAPTPAFTSPPLSPLDDPPPPPRPEPLQLLSASSTNSFLLRAQLPAVPRRGGGGGEAEVAAAEPSHGAGDERVPPC